MHCLAFVLDGAGQETAGTAGRIKYHLVQLWIEPINDELSNGAGSVELARVSRALQVFQNLFINRTERVAIVAVVEIDLVYLVDHLPQQGTGFHVVVGVLEHIADDLCALADFADGRKLIFEDVEQLIHKLDERIAGDAFPIGRPIAPAETVGDCRHTL